MFGSSLNPNFIILARRGCIGKYHAEPSVWRRAKRKPQERTDAAGAAATPHFKPLVSNRGAQISRQILIGRNPIPKIKGLMHLQMKVTKSKNITSYHHERNKGNKNG